MQKDFKKLYIGIVSFCLFNQELEAEWSLFLQGGFEDCQCQCVMMKKLFVMALMIIRLVKIGWQWPTHKSANPAQDQGGGQATTKHKIETILQNVGKTNWTTKTRGWVVGVKEEEMGAVIRHAVIQSGEVSGLTWGPHERVKRGA